MLFNSFEYILFLPCVVALYYILPQKIRWALLLVASYYFYMSWNANLIVLIATTTLTAYVAALQIQKVSSNAGNTIIASGETEGAEKSENEEILNEKANAVKTKKRWLILTCAVSLGLLFYFKYFNFFSQSTTQFLRSISLPVDDFTVNVMLPVGISFYTFQTLSYVVDVYKGKMKAEKHLGIFALYVSFFPQLVAGPIERAENLLPQFHKKHNLTADNASWGLRMICFGLFKKMFVADFVAPFSNAVFNNAHDYTPMSMAVATLFFAVQIYCDFSGYSDIALGSAKILGFDLMVNFNTPYFSKTIREFWQRWHISLSSFLRDYVYIPLGGSKKGKRRTVINLLLTFLISGLWHGAAWTFVLWGAMHGIGQAVGNFTNSARKNVKLKLKIKDDCKIYALFQMFFVFAFVCASWVLFRANSLQDAVYIISQLPKAVAFPVQNFNQTMLHLGVGTYEKLHILFGFVVLFAFDFIRYKHKGDPFVLLAKQKAPVRFGVSYTLAMCSAYAFLTVPVGVVAEFIYFQF